MRSSSLANGFDKRFLIWLRPGYNNNSRRRCCASRLKRGLLLNGTTRQMRPACSSFWHRGLPKACFMAPKTEEEDEHKVMKPTPFAKVIFLFGEPLCNAFAV